MEDQKQISPSMLTLIASYRSQIILSKSKQTVEAYTKDVTGFLEYLQYKGIKRISSIKGQNIISYLGYKKSLGKSDASLNRYYMSIRSFCRYLRITRVITEDICLDVSAPMFKQKAPYVPNVEEMRAILNAPDTSTERGKRDRAILELLYSSGLRATELCDLEFKDLQGETIIVRCGKRGNTRTVPVTQEAVNAILEYAKDRGREAGALFCTVTGRGMDRQRLCKMVGQYAKQAGIEGVTTHTLRHACATHLLDQGADLRLIQEVLGHSSIASTQRYTHLSSNKMQEMFKHFHPRKQPCSL